MDTVPACVAAFLSGAVYELGCVFWVHHSENGHARRTAGWSMLCASCQVLGIGESVHAPIAAPFFVAGYGFGSWVGVTVAKRELRA